MKNYKTGGWKKFLLVLAALLLASAPAFATAVTINAKIANGNPIYNHLGSPNYIALNTFYQVIESTDSTANPPDASGNPTGDDALVGTGSTGNINPAGEIVGKNCNATAGKYIYVRVWEGATSAATISSATYYGQSIPANVGTGFVMTGGYNPASFSTNVIIDTTPPGPPIGLTASPVSWTATNSFGLSWTNPADASGIASSYYKLDTAPTTNTDGTAGGASSLSGVTVSGSGAHTIYVWLKDNNGNVSYANNATTTLYFDGTAPTFTGSITGPSSPRNNTSLAFDWSGTSASDAHSGLASSNRYYYLLNQSPTATGSTVKTSGSGTMSTAATVTATGSGTWYLHVICQDAVGNVSAVINSAAIIVDVTGPTMTFNPLGGTTGVSTTQNIVITFSEAINTGTFAYNVNPNPGGLSVAWSGGNTVATISHTAFANSTVYTVTVTAAQDTLGNNYTGNNTASFTTAGAGAPTISNIYKSGTTVNNAYVYENVEVNGNNFGEKQAGGTYEAPTGSTIELMSQGGSYVTLADSGANDVVWWWSNSKIEFMVPYKVLSTITVAGNATVRVTTPSGNITGTFTIKPKIYAVTPNSGLVGSGFTVEGTAFHTTAGSNTVGFSGTNTAASGITTGSTTSVLNVVVPSLTAGQKNLSVTVNSYESNVATVEITVSAPVLTPEITSVFNKVNTTEAAVYVTPYDPTWSGTPDYTLNLLVKGNNFGQKNSDPSNNDNANPPSANHKIAVKPYGYSNFVNIPDDPSTPPDRMYWWLNDQIEIGLPEQLGGYYVVAGPAKIKVTTPSGSSSEKDLTVKPKIYGVSPVSGPVGTKVVINGTALGSSPAAVLASFNGTTTNAATVTPNTIEVYVPAGATTGSLQLIVNGALSNTTYADGSPITFVVTSSVEPALVSILPNHATQGQTLDVLITGQNVSWEGDQTSKVHFSGNGISVVSARGSGTTISANITIASSATAESRTVTVDGVSGSLVFTVEEAGPGPLIISVNPAAAPTGARFIVTGERFGATQGRSLLLFNNLLTNASYQAEIVSWSDTTIEAKVPALAPTGKYELKVSRISIVAGTLTAQDSNTTGFNVTATAATGTLLVYPNPFNPVSETVTFVVTDTSGATNLGFYIYDMTARLVKREVVSTSQTTWNGIDQYGQVVGDGAFMVRVLNEDTKGLIAKGKLLVVKH